jgi:hypothetical protein
MTRDVMDDRPALLDELTPTASDGRTPLDGEVEGVSKFACPRTLEAMASQSSNLPPPETGPSSSAARESGGLKATALELLLYL